jgi:hypothetical protein
MTKYCSGDNEMNKDMLSHEIIKKGYAYCFAMDGQESNDWLKVRCQT